MDIELARVLVAIAALVISLLAFLNSRKSKVISEKALALAERADRKSSIEYLDSIPSLEVVEILEMGDQKRAKLHVANLRGNPFKIHCLRVYKQITKNWNIRNLILSKVDPKFDWNYEFVEGCVWNPKGNLDDEEKYFEEAAKFLVVMDDEYILVSIPGFKYGQKYKYELQTTHGNRSITNVAYECGKTYFSTNFEQTYV